jgi:ABC-type proline/glycine betaine transport system ATPase subunit
VAILNQGRIEQVGTTPQIINQPANAFVADFIAGVSAAKPVSEQKITWLKPVKHRT